VLDQGMLKVDARCSPKRSQGSFQSAETRTGGDLGSASPCDSRGISPMPSRPINPEPPSPALRPASMVDTELDIDMDAGMLKHEDRGGQSPAKSPLPARPINPEPPQTPKAAMDSTTRNDGLDQDQIDLECDQGILGALCNGADIARMLSQPMDTVLPPRAESCMGSKRSAPQPGSRSESRMGTNAPALPVETSMIDMAFAGMPESVIADAFADSLEVELETVELDVDLDAMMLTVDAKVSQSSPKQSMGRQLQVDADAAASAGRASPSPFGFGRASPMPARPVNPTPPPTSASPEPFRSAKTHPGAYFAPFSTDSEVRIASPSNVSPEADHKHPNGVERGRALFREDEDESPERGRAANWAASPLGSPESSQVRSAWAAEEAYMLSAEQEAQATIRIQATHRCNAELTLVPASDAQSPHVHSTLSQTDHSWALQEQIWASLSQQYHGSQSWRGEWLNHKMLQMRQALEPCLPAPFSTQSHPASSLGKDRRAHVAPMLLEIISTSSRRAASLRSDLNDLHEQLEERNHTAAHLEQQLASALQKVAELRANAADVRRQSIEAEGRYLKLHAEYQQPLLRLEEESLEAQHMQLDAILNSKEDSRLACFTRSGVSTACSSYYSRPSRPASSLSSTVGPLASSLPTRPASALGSRGWRAGCP